MDELLIKSLYKNLVNTVNNVPNDKFKYLLNKGIDLLVEEELLFLSIATENYSILSEKLQELKETNDIYLLEEIINIYGSQSNVRYDSINTERIVSHINNIDDDEFEEFLSKYIKKYQNYFKVKTVGTFLDYILKKLEKRLVISNAMNLQGGFR